MLRAPLKYAGLLALLVLGSAIGGNVSAAAAQTGASHALMAVPVAEITLEEEVKKCEESQKAAEKQLGEEEEKIKETIAKEEAKEAELEKAKEEAREKWGILERLFSEWPESVKKLQKEVEAIEGTRTGEEEAWDKETNKFLNEHGIFSECYEKKEKLKEQKEREEKPKLEETTTVPEETTTVPQETTTVPESTTTAPEPTTTVPEPTTTAPQATATTPGV